MEEPKPCIWCKETKKSRIIGRNLTGEYRIEHFCKVATILGKQWYKDETDAIAAWNTRAGDER